MKKHAVLIVTGIAALAIPVLAAMNAFQDFEKDIADWTGVTRVSSRTGGVDSSAGFWHAEVPLTAALPAVHTKFGGYESRFPSGGYTTAIDVYLNVAGGYADGTRFDWSSAINDPNRDHRRDFIFAVGFYTENGKGRFVISTSNNGFDDPKNRPNPITITTSGWYTFVHRFYDKGAGVLASEMSVTALDGDEELGSWILTDPTDIIGSTVGGHRYGWFVNNEFPGLAIDNVKLIGPKEPATLAACKREGYLTVVKANGDRFKTPSECFKYVKENK